MAQGDLTWENGRVVMTAIALLDEARPIIDENLAGLTDDEYMWEPVPGCWSVRRREEVRSPGHWGRGPWVVEVSMDGSVEPSMTTIAWRLMHAYDCATDFSSRAMGGAGHDWNDIDIPAQAANAVAIMTDGLDEIAAALSTSKDEVLRGDPDPLFRRPRWELLMKSLHEPIHHCAEIGVLRTLWRGLR